MPCTTILVGKKASFDGSTMVARTEDYKFSPKKLKVMLPSEQPRVYKTVTSHLEIELPEEPLRYTCTPNCIPDRGAWCASGINAENVGMTATETLTANSVLLAADPMVNYQKAEEGREEIPGGIGEEDIVLLVLPYIRSAREGVLRLGKLLETYGTYEKNGIAFNDADECWWLETIGGHHWIARRVQDDEVAIMPNQLGIDRFDLEDAFGAQQNFLCAPDMREFLKDRMYFRGGSVFNPRHVFGTDSDRDRMYNTPRAWMISKTLCPNTYRWSGENADYRPDSNNIPWSMVPERPLKVEDVRNILALYYQRTPYDPYGDGPESGKYRPIATPRTNVTSVCQLRGYMPKQLQAIHWISFATTHITGLVPQYANVNKTPAYFCNVENRPSTDNFCWASHILAAVAEPHFADMVKITEAYQDKVLTDGLEVLYEYDAKVIEGGDISLLEEANEKIAASTQKNTDKILDETMELSRLLNKVFFHREDYYRK